MERLTKQMASGEWIVIGNRQEAADRLAAYESTGLTPEEIEAMKAENERLNKENFWLTNGGGK